MKKLTQREEMQRIREAHQRVVGAKSTWRRGKFFRVVTPKDKTEGMFDNQNRRP